ncbi:DHA2 family multidrug resistance protein-like MFS transporter [Paraburkholderia sp. CI2]|nr:MFS transporter [Paraburkholderia sp. CI2]MBB5466814.1 DHA2 family multidrug resistance protein-like MFS transporter [Paraburkholderia sp. CI2]
MNTVSDPQRQEVAEDLGEPMSSDSRKAMGAVLLAVALASLDTAIANTALPQIAADLHTTPSASVWIINAYQLSMVATLLPFASLGERVGHKRVFIGGVSIFLIASLLCALAPSLNALTAARVLQGVGAAAVMSVNVALIRFLYPAHRLGRGVGLNALVVGVSFAVGPTVASLLLAIASWPWLFAINIPLGLLALAFGLPNLPATPKRDALFDPLAALLNAVAFAALIFALGHAAQRASWQTVVISLGVTLAGGVLLIRREAGHRAPMLPIDLFRRPMFALSTLTAISAFAAQGLAFVSLPFFFENVLSRSQVETGFLMTPWPVMVAAIAPIAGRLSDRYSPGALGGIGLGLLCIGMTLLALMPTHPGVLDISLRMALCGLGFGFFQSPNLKAFMASAPPERSGGASGVIGTARLLGQATGAALVALSFGIAGHHGPVLALAWGAGFAAVGCVASALRVMGGKVSIKH